MKETYDDEEEDSRKNENVSRPVNNIFPHGICINSDRREFLIAVYSSSCSKMEKLSPRTGVAHFTRPYKIEERLPVCVTGS